MAGMDMRPYYAQIRASDIWREAGISGAVQP